MTALLETLREAFAAKAIQIAHLKAYARSDSYAWKASLTGSNVESISWDKRSLEQVSRAQFILNVRANDEPHRIEAIVRHSLRTVADIHQIDSEVSALDCFSPAPPKPVYRLLIG
jgi:hypothetical protein